jgi:hypothetical protein
MMDISTFEKLHAEGLISDDTLGRLKDRQRTQLFSLFWETRSLLYLGVLLLAGGLGVVVYKNIDTIGHQAVLAFIALVTIGCFFYCWRKKAPFSWDRVNAPTPVFDYILLLGCLSLLIFLAYLQYAYNVFGDNYGLATFIPMVILFLTAYVFDHLGVLSLAITNLAAWAGVTITPLALLKGGNFDTPRLIYTGLALGAVLLAMGRMSEQRQLKAHFEITYTNFGVHLFFVAALAGLFHFDNSWLAWFLGLMAAAFFCFRQAMARHSLYFVVAILLYAYIGLSDVIIRLLDRTLWRSEGALYLLLIYFIGSAVGIIAGLMRINKHLKAHDRV